MWRTGKIQKVNSENCVVQGRTEGRTEGILITLVWLVRDGILSINDAAFRANMSKSDYKDAMERLSGTK